ncbi:hypothetical protein AL065_03890 [Pseudomonas amygdali pv. ulmi]|nr:hypothetical protein AL065_03890 [Pseudomonas amygdali pv. ulmi]
MVLNQVGKICGAVVVSPPKASLVVYICRADIGAWFHTSTEQSFQLHRAVFVFVIHSDLLNMLIFKPFDSITLGPEAKPPPC